LHVEEEHTSIESNFTIFCNLLLPWVKNNDWLIHSLVGGKLKRSITAICINYKTPIINDGDIEWEYSFLADFWGGGGKDSEPKPAPIFSAWGQSNIS